MSTTCPTHEQRQSIQLYVLNTVSTFGILHTPRHTASPYPLVIILHGLASNKVGSHRSHVELAEKLSLCGIAALRVDLPGHGDAEGSLTDFSFYDYLTSVKDIIAYSHSLNNIDINKISIFGSSLGGTLALLSAPYISSIHSLAVWAPTIQGRLWLQEAMNASNNNLFTHSSSSEDILYAGLPISKIFCTQFIEIDITKEISAFPLSLPLLHMQGMEDTIVSPHHQKIFKEAMHQASHPCDIRSYPQVNHTFPHSGPIIMELVEWLKQQLLP
ncbi:alpha/beta hydrolase family protein [Chlamydia gallinacea]|uniref:Acetyltransferase n=2 Tax=Chlamydia gallinacea TaxID=1457153 RepID=A0A173E0A5_9CHLA|nr:alpha/beta hydrolase [Chlamydia gallinacea]ANG66595.1 acetyltransferase [Chlamydia gallinacea 08-1274/3]EYE60256.1 dienelactone hydrolase family protein [Bacteroides fragilis str. S6L5]MBX6679945.1 alpha/beta hydrolase [Chlamydia gallinacea]MBX6687167.1 alpha/beta hydrolase [Chlamydia gallinacea]